MRSTYDRVDAVVAGPDDPLDIADLKRRRFMSWMYFRADAVLAGAGQRLDVGADSEAASAPRDIRPDVVGGHPVRGGLVATPMRALRHQLGEGLVAVEGAVAEACRSWAVPRHSNSPGVALDLEGHGLRRRGSQVGWTVQALEGVQRGRAAGHAAVARRLGAECELHDIGGCSRARRRPPSCTVSGTAARVARPVRASAMAVRATPQRRVLARIGHPPARSGPAGSSIGPAG